MTSAVKPITLSADPQARPLESTRSLPNPLAPSLGTSDIRTVFEEPKNLKKEFTQFLTTIFYQLDEKKVFAIVDEILKDSAKTDEQIYQELLGKIDSMKKPFPIFYKLYSLFVLKKGMGEQAKVLLSTFNSAKFNDYLEVYDRRYLNTLRKMVGLPLRGTATAVSDTPAVDVGARLQAGAFFSSFPYKNHLGLNDPDCKDPLKEPGKTHKPLSDEVKDASLDLIGCLGGLHHVPQERAEAFAASLARKLRPGAVLLFRDHDCQIDSIRAIASVVHTFVNLADNVSWLDESQEIREFKKMQDWTTLLARHGLVATEQKRLILKDDPTGNGMIALVKQPKTLEELKIASTYQKESQRTLTGPKSTWIEWGNVRFAKSYADFLQTHHSYAFDCMGHLKQHFEHFKEYIKAVRANPKISWGEAFFSEDTTIALFILVTAAIQLSFNHVLNLPAQAVARVRFGLQWRSVTNLTAFEKFQAEKEKEYSEFILHTFFYHYPWITRMKQMWCVIYKSDESLGIKALSVISAIGTSIGLLSTALISLPLRILYGASNLPPAFINAIIKDPENSFESLIGESGAQVIFNTGEGHKLVRLPRFQPMKELMLRMSQIPTMELVEIAGHTSIPVDIKSNDVNETPRPGATLVYEQPILHATGKMGAYEVKASELFSFLRAQGASVEYIHE